MAGDASRAGEVVVVIDVAIGALPRWHGMHTRQREVGQIVVERRI